MHMYMYTCVRNPSETAAEQCILKPAVGPSDSDDDDNNNTYYYCIIMNMYPINYYHHYYYYYYVCKFNGNEHDNNY